MHLPVIAVNGIQRALSSAMHHSKLTISNESYKSSITLNKALWETTQQHPAQSVSKGHVTPPRIVNKSENVRSSERLLSIHNARTGFKTILSSLSFWGFDKLFLWNTWITHVYISFIGVEVQRITRAYNSHNLKM